MSKEWLEEIRKLLVNLYNAVDVDEEMKHYIFNDLKIEWLIEQAEKTEIYKEALENIEALSFFSDGFSDKEKFVAVLYHAKKALEESK